MPINSCSVIYVWMKDFIVFLPNYTEKPDSWSNNFLNLEVSSKRKLSEITPDLKTILIITQVLDNAFHFIQCSYVIIVNISISGPNTNQITILGGPLSLTLHCWPSDICSINIHRATTISSILDTMSYK